MQKHQRVAFPLLKRNRARDHSIPLACGGGGFLVLVLLVSFNCLAITPIWNNTFTITWHMAIGITHLLTMVKSSNGFFFFSSTIVWKGGTQGQYHHHPSHLLLCFCTCHIHLHTHTHMVISFLALELGLLKALSPEQNNLTNRMSPLKLGPWPLALASSLTIIVWKGASSGV